MARPTHEKKLRADSKLNALDDLQLERLNELLLTPGTRLSDARVWLEERGVAMSEQSISEYYRTRVLPKKWEHFNLAAEQLNKVSAEAVSSAAHKAVAQAVFELSTQAQIDPKSLEKMYRLMLAGEASQQAERRIAMLEARLERAEAAKEHLQERVKNGGLSAEALQEIEAALKLM